MAAAHVGRRCAGAAGEPGLTRGMQVSGDCGLGAAVTTSAASGGCPAADGSSLRAG